MGVEGSADPAQIIRAVEEVSPEPVLRMTMLLHDAGKPYTRTTDEKGVGHYKGHQACSAALAAEVLEKLRFDRESEKRIVRLVEAHDIPLSTERKILLRRLNQFGEKDLRALFQIHRADRIATGTRNPDHAKEHCRELNEALDALLAENLCFTLKDLAVNGRDLTAAGLRGKEIGETLERLLGMVMDGQIVNERDALMDEAAKDIKKITR
jgi:tRNA nucleotidyltransferase (CCA-adding enzyme)